VVICLQQGAVCSHVVQLMTLHPKTPPMIVFVIVFVLNYLMILIRTVLACRKPLSEVDLTINLTQPYDKSYKIFSKSGSWRLTNLHVYMCCSDDITKQCRVGEDLGCESTATNQVVLSSLTFITRNR